MDYSDKIISFCKNNRVSTTEVADALGKSGVLPDVLPITSSIYRVGKVKCIYTSHNSNWAVHEQIKEVLPGDVVLIFTKHCDDDRAIIGDLISKFILLYKQASAIVVVGKVRDAARLIKDRYAVWSRGVSPLGCFNKYLGNFPPEEMSELDVSYNNGIAVCDDGGVSIIPQSRINEDMLKRLHRIEMQEDIWSFCLDTLKWDTKKIVCDKDYLKETDLLSSIHIDQLSELNKPLD
jgi:4-hydroxy-4-methyl-2-oxoglutarate aldolase